MQINLGITYTYHYCALNEAARHATTDGVITLTHKIETAIQYKRLKALIFDIPVEYVNSRHKLLSLSLLEINIINKGKENVK